MQESTEGYVWNDIDDDKRKWFRPSDVAVGTDGAIYIADWYDPVVGGHQMMDSIGYGRIYRLTPKEKQLKSPTIDLGTTKGQIAALLNPAINVRSLGFQKLEEQGEAVVDDVLKILESDNTYHKARAVWLLSKLGNEGIAIVENILKKEPDPRLRVVAYRALKNDEKSVLKYADISADDPAEEVRREVAISLRDVPWEKSAAINKALFDNFDGEDPWYLEALGMAMDGKEESAYKELVANESENPAEWSEKFSSLVWRLHPKSAVAALKERATAENVDDDSKRRAVDALAFVNDKDAVLAMMDLKNGEGNPIVQESANWWVDFRKTNDWYALNDWRSEAGITFEIPEEIAAQQKILLDTTLSMKDRTAAGKNMAKTLIGGRLLIALAISDQLPSKLSQNLSKAIFENPFQEVRTLASGYFTKSKESELSQRKILTLTGDQTQGENLFTAKCASCHKNDKGGNDIGPNLSNIGGKFDTSVMVDAIVNPNASIVFGYQPVMIKTKAGQAFYGFLLSEGETTVIKDVTGNQIVIAPDEIESKEKIKTGIMPDAKALGLNEQNLADLAAYLLTLKNTDV